MFADSPGVASSLTLPSVGVPSTCQKPQRISLGNTFFDVCPPLLAVNAGAHGAEYTDSVWRPAMQRPDDGARLGGIVVVVGPPSAAPAPPPLACWNAWMTCSD